MDRKIEAFRQQALTRRKGRKRGAAQYDAAARELACDHARQARQRGRSWSAIAQDLGLSPITLRKWCRAEVESRLVPVTVTTSPPPHPRPAVTVVTPGGLRIEGLEVNEAVLLVRALGVSESVRSSV